MSDRPDLTVVVVSYNVRTYLAACLRAVEAACAPLRARVVVVDNASADGSADLVAREFPDARLVRNAENRGFAAAVNQGMALADGRAVVLLNPDAVAPPGALASLVSVAERHAEAGLVAPVLRDPETGEIQPSFRPFPTWRSTFAHYTFAKLLLRRLPSPPWTPVMDRPTDAGWLSGACLLIRRDVLERVGGLDEGFFMWLEDTDYCRRVIAAGWHVLRTSAVTVYHHEGRSARQERAEEVRLQELRSVFHYLVRAFPAHTRRLKPVFKAALLATLVGRLVPATLKVALYALGAHGDKLARHHARLQRDARFLRRSLRAFLAL